MFRSKHVGEIGKESCDGAVASATAWVLWCGSLRSWHTRMAIHPAYIQVANGCSEATSFTWHFDLMVLWSYICRMDSMPGIHRTPSRGPFGALAFAAMSLWNRACFVNAIYSRGCVDGGHINRHRRWSWRRVVAVSRMTVARLPVVHLERSLLLLWTYGIESASRA